MLYSFFNWIQKLSMGEDLAERVDDLICAWDKVVGTDLDTVVVLLLGAEIDMARHLNILNYFRMAWIWRSNICSFPCCIFQHWSWGQSFLLPPSHYPTIPSTRPGTKEATRVTCCAQTFSSCSSAASTGRGGGV